MSESLQFENSTLRQRLEDLLQEARQNEVKQRRFDQLERQLIGARSLAELVRLLLVDYREVFGIESVSLVLVDPECELARILDVPGSQALQLQRSARELVGLYGAEPGTRLCAYDSRAHAGLFDAPAGSIASVALLPLLRGGELIGSLNLGSAVAERYDSGAGTSFLDRLAVVVAICVENAIAHERLKRAGLTDALTGVQNRRYFEHRSLAEVSQALRHRQSLACMFLDIDHFKRINDTHGHQAGDDVLRDVAGIIQTQLRASDTIARYGGEEFVVLLPQTGAAFAHDIAERIRVAVAANDFSLPTGESSVSVTISIGLAMLGAGVAGEEASLAVALVAEADRALYEAKHGGRNRVAGAITANSPRPLHESVSLWRQGWQAIKAFLHLPDRSPLAGRFGSSQRF